MIERIVPAEAETAEAYGDLPEATLFPEEALLVKSAVAQRRGEFTTARHCARQALTRLGAPAGAILTGERGAPLWPEGVVGSITHCAGYRAAVVARPAHVAAIGVDAEPALPLPEGVLEAVALPDEQIAVKELLVTAPGVAWDRLLFSAKESVYKAWFPLTRRFLEFEEARLVFDPAGGTFTAHLLAGPARAGGRTLHRFEGRWLSDGGIVLTSVTVPA
ncbi:4'-phosphopantetheinyl transferase Npt [Streptomyces sp. S4.7]|uniref:4'-phosphopantetheinyl transferase family protein n=1 Tax=unclassified Streptomyces TaxID=2593676 RepID=UPI0011C9ACC7|nr:MULTISPECIES: 4'-phosphopantetheinyl transferase superfamily protein [unclassified Streptomyces]QHY99591.1 4'-phosphopantetheinyl transferase Npt [Streptomyces sp. S4.7]TXL85732.1 4'-phosphopantetheinyl transferase superfamily protein [Streptomyces sp. IB2014 016-6]